MSGGVAALWWRDGRPAEAAALDRVLGALSHRGPDGGDVWQVGPVVLGHRHFWTVPEEVGERQPLAAAGGQVALAVDGRLDNRDEVMAALGERAVDGFARARAGSDGAPALSDAALILAAYLRFGHDAWTRLVGPLALVLWDGRRDEMALVRDPMGARTLFYASSPHRLLVASEPAAVLRGPEVPPTLDEITMIQWLAADVPGDGRTFWSAVREAIPGEALVLGREGERRGRYWQAPAEVDEPARSQAAWAEAFRETLARAVACRRRAVSSPALAMSGGLDSTSVAALALGQLRREARPASASDGSSAALLDEVQGLGIFSWVFDDLPSCDERAYISAVAAALGTGVQMILGDALWPLAKPAPANPNGPDGNPYRLLKEALYAEVAHSGANVLLTGGFGDHLYAKFSGADLWLADRWTRLGWPGRAGEWWRMAKLEGLRSPFTRAATRRLAGRLAAHEPRRQPAGPGAAVHAWLTPGARGRLPAARLDTASAHHARRWAHHELLLGREAAFSASRETYFAGAHRLEVRHPFRDRRLAELVLRMPADMLYQPGGHKFVLRLAMRGALPPMVLERGAPTSLAALFARWREKDTWDRVCRLVRAPGAAWPNFVRASAVERCLQARPDGPARSAEAEDLLLWHLASLELWLRGAHQQA